MTLHHGRNLAVLAIVLPVLHGCGGQAPEENAATGASPSPSSTLNSATNSTAGSATGNPQSGAASTSFEADKVPPQEELVKLVETTLLEWNEGVQKKDFTKFHGTVAKMWQKQMSPAKMAEVFKPITDQNEKGSNIAPAVKKWDPTLTPAAVIDEHNLLVVQGYYPTKPSKTTFKLKYIAEDGAWKSAGVSMDFHK